MVTPDRVPGKPPAAPKPNGRERTLRLLLLAGIGLLLLAAAASAVLQPEAPDLTTYGLMIAGHLVALAVLRAGRLRLAVTVHAALYLLVVAYTTAALGGLRSPVGIILPPIVLLVGLTWSGRAAMVTAALASALALAMLIAEERGLLAASPAVSARVFWVVATTTLIITAIMLEVALRSIARAERQAREAELERARYAEQLERSRRLETVGRMAAGLAHDFNNLLTVVLGQASLLARGGDERTVTGARLIVDTAERASVLTRKLLAFGRRQALEPRRLDLNEVVRSAEPLLRRSVEGRERLRLELAPEPLPLRADATQLEQVLLNLVGNAAEATVERGEITIRTARATNGGASAPTAVVLGVIDTGIGMSDEVQSRLFEPFFTTKPPGEGTGLGMASVHGIVEQSGGTIWVASRLGDGTRIEVHLPAAERDEPPAAAHGS